MNCLFFYLINKQFIHCGKMEPVPNREFLLDYINSHNIMNSRNIINDYNDYNILNNLVRNRAERENIDLIHNIYINHLNNNYIYNHGQAAAAEAVEPVVVASALSTFERLNLDVSLVSQEENQDSEDTWICSICCENSEEEEIKEERVITKCNHTFHSKCLKKWAVQKTTCPMCRASLKKN